MAYAKPEFYYPKNRQKYIGLTNPEYRSGWERKAFLKLDENPKVVRWGSENFVIPYFFELDGKKHRYYVDLYVEMNAGNKIEKYLIEIKPDKKLFYPEKPKTKNRRSLRNYNLQLVDHRKNLDKWIFASQYATSKGMEFLIMTEKGTYIVEANNLKKISDKSYFLV